MECRQPVRFRRLTDQTHACFIRCAATFAVIATETRSDDIVPLLLTTRRDRNDVIESQIFRRKFLTAVLTRVIVASVDVGTGKLDAIVILDANVLEKPDD